MTKNELIKEISDKAEVTQAAAAKMLDAFTDTVMHAVSGGDKVPMMGFGTFELRHREARSGRNPQTGETVTIAASNTPAFKAGKVFKDLCNGGK